MIVIGSKALTFRLQRTDEVVNRCLKADYDVLMSQDEFHKWYSLNRKYILKIYPTQLNKYKAVALKNEERKQYEIEIATEGSSAKLLLDNAEAVTDFVIDGFLDDQFATLTPEYQMLTKRSHLVYPVHFEKNMDDYNLLRKMANKSEHDGLMQEYYFLRSEEAKERYSKFKTPKLNVSNEDFFSSKLAVKNYFIHDDIHEVMKHHEKPVYEMMKKDFTMAKCEKDLFFELPYTYQLQAVQEEAYTIALERYIIPQAGEDWMDYFNCYKKALKRICTTLCSGWFRDFAIDNYEEAIHQYSSLFVDKFWSSYKSGKIKLIEGRELPRSSIYELDAHKMK
ncbi:hypothetical protein EBB07_28620 [Paenibacillaceae bacterium]|nr:hypothetical protein EBB07_28620 [Paenibacillaceae bacterium]